MESLFIKTKKERVLQAIKEVKSGKGCPKNIFIPIDTSLFSETDKKNWKGKNILNRIEITVKGSRINQHELALTRHTC